MNIKLYKVQTWSADGALQNAYEVEIGSSAELAHLRKFLQKKSAHVVLTLLGPVVAKRVKR